MYKRRSTLQSNEKAKKNKMTEFLLELDRCMQIPNDDKLIIRRKIKDSDEDVITLFEMLKRDKNYHQLQIKLRKIIQVQKNIQKRYTINYVDRDRKKAEHNQRIYSQNSQNASYKNSVKASPQKEDVKKTLISFDICELKKKMEESSNQNKINFHIDSSRSKSQIRINSISKVNTSINKSRENSFDKLPLRQQRSPFTAANINIGQQKGKVMSSIKQNPSKITLRINDRKSPSRQNKENKSRIIEQPFQNQQKQSQNQNEKAGISYSSSIKNLLMSKLKDQKQSRKEKIVLKDSKKCEDSLMSNRSMSEFNEQTILKKPTRPMTRDEIIQYPKHFDETYEKFPMYIQTTEQSEDDRSTLKKLEEFGYNNSKVMKAKPQKLQTLLNVESEQQKYGQFYLKIKNIIYSKNY